MKRDRYGIRRAGRALASTGAGLRREHGRSVTAFRPTPGVTSDVHVRLYDAEGRQVFHSDYSGDGRFNLREEARDAFDEWAGMSGRSGWTGAEYASVRTVCKGVDKSAVFDKDLSKVDYKEERKGSGTFRLAVGAAGGHPGSNPYSEGDWAPNWESRRRIAQRCGFGADADDGCEIYASGKTKLATGIQVQGILYLNTFEGYVEAKIVDAEKSSTLLSAFHNVDDAILDAADSGDTGRLDEFLRGCLSSLAHAVSAMEHVGTGLDGAVGN